MSVVSNKYPARPLPDTEARIEELTALAYVILDRLSKVEETVSLLALSAGIDAPPPSPCEWVYGEDDGSHLELL